MRVAIVRRLLSVLLPALCLLPVAFAAPAARAEQATVAVAANFAEPLETLQGLFEERTGHIITVVSGSTGKLYAQIAHGAPYDLLLAADAERPARLAEEGLGVAASRFTYAIGRLALWSPDPARVTDDLETVLRRPFRHLAIANPALAPYGAAARETLAALGLWQALEPKLVRGENVAQAFQMVATGNAELGLVALAYVRSPRNPAPGSHRAVPPHLHAPIRQDAILLARAADNAAAHAFMDFLRSPEAAAVIERFGYAAE